jgi:hypothetical protein
MSATLLINENQKRIILRESVNDEFGDMVKQNYRFVKDVLKMSSQQMGMNFEFLFTWGASIGGFIGPLNEFISGRFPNVSDVEMSLILTGIIATFYMNNKEMIRKILERIKSEGLSEEFKTSLNKANQLKSTFVDFMDGLNITLHSVTNIMSYAFIIPLIPIVYSAVISGAFKTGDAKEIAIRLSSFGVLTVSGIVVKELFSKLIRVFKEKN